MKEVDQRIVNAAKKLISDDIALKRENASLQSQLRAIKEKGEPFCLFYKKCMTKLPPDSGLVWRVVTIENEAKVTVENFRALAEELEKVGKPKEKEKVTDE